MALCHSVWSGKGEDGRIGYSTDGAEWMRAFPLEAPASEAFVDTERFTSGLPDFCHHAIPRYAHPTVDDDCGNHFDEWHEGNDIN